MPVLKLDLTKRHFTGALSGAVVIAATCRAALQDAESCSCRVETKARQAATIAVLLAITIAGTLVECGFNGFTDSWSREAVAGDGGKNDGGRGS